MLDVALEYNISHMISTFSQDKDRKTTQCFQYRLNQYSPSITTISIFISVLAHLSANLYSVDHRAAHDADLFKNIPKSNSFPDKDYSVRNSPHFLSFSLLCYAPVFKYSPSSSNFHRRFHMVLEGSAHPQDGPYNFQMSIFPSLLRGDNYTRRLVEAQRPADRG